MWRCCVCGCECEEPEKYSYTEDMNGEGAYQAFWVNICPTCGSEEVEEEKG